MTSEFPNRVQRRGDQRARDTRGVVVKRSAGNFLLSPREGTYPGIGQSQGSVVLYLASPCAGNDVNALIRELTALAGIRRVVPMAKFSRLLRVDYDRRALAVRTLLDRVQRRWSTARLVGA